MMDKTVEERPLPGAAPERPAATGQHQPTGGRVLTGRMVLAGFVCAFGLIIAVNVTMATQALRTFPGLETRNSYVASQSFDADRDAQLALGWTAEAVLDGGMLRLRLTDAAGGPVAARMVSATFGRATSTRDDQSPDFVFDGTAHVAPVVAGRGNWNLRLVAQAPDGTLFRQRIVIRTPRA